MLIVQTQIEQKTKKGAAVFGWSYGGIFVRRWSWRTKEQ